MKSGYNQRKYKMKETPEFKFLVCEGLDSSFIPTRCDPFATGWDVKAAKTVEMFKHKTSLIPLGIKCFAPKNYWLELRPRSSTFGKLNLHALYGVIDESYEGELLFACSWMPDTNFAFNAVTVIEKGTRLGQLVPVRRQEMLVSEVSAEEFDTLCKERGMNRGAGGFGSTGK